MSKILNVLIWVVIIVVILFLIVLFSQGDHSITSGRSKDYIIASSIEEARTLMVYVCVNEGDCDNFNCEQEDMKKLCDDIDMAYGDKDGREPVIVHNFPVGSQEVCIYSPLNRKEESGWWLFKNEIDLWMCADSSREFGYTNINPGSQGYCHEGGDIICPPFIEKPK